MTPPRSSAARRQEEDWIAFTSAIDPAAPGAFEDHLAAFRKIYARRAAADGPPPAWLPSREGASSSNLGRLMERLGISGYAELHAWSARERPAFWEEAIRTIGIRFARPPSAILDPSRGVKDPCWLPGASMSCVTSCFKAPGAEPAIVSGREGARELEVLSRERLRGMADSVARGLRAKGFGPGDPIALYMPMTPECVAAYLGIILAGCAAVSIADSFPPAELRRRLEIASARALVTLAGYVRAGKHFDLLDKVNAAGAPCAIVIPEAGSTPPDLRPGDLAWEDLLSAGGAAEDPAGDPYRTINVLFSSGTTGTPKAIPWTHLTPIKCSMDGRFHQDIRSGDVVAWPTNIGWMMGPWLIFASLMNDATMALYNGAPHGAGFRDFVRDAKVNVLGVIPSLVRAWRSGGLWEAPGWESLRVFSSTGEPSSREDYLWLMSRTAFRAPVIEYLGGTEIGGGHITGTVVQPASPATFTTPALGLDFVLLDERHRLVPEGSSGELFLIPPSIGLSQRLLNADHEAVYHHGVPAGPHGETLRRHGDVFERLHQGCFRAHGRADDTMNLGGIKISALEIERVVQAHEAVYECAAVSVQPEGEGAERLVLYVVPAVEPLPPDLRAQLGKLIARELNPLFRVHDLVPRPSLPRTASGKLMRRALRADYSQGDEGRS